MNTSQVRAGLDSARRRWCWVAALGFGALLSTGSSIADPSSLGALEGDAVLATRGGVSVTADDLRARILIIPEDMRGGVMSDPTRFRTLIQQLLETKEFAESARAAGLDKSERFIAEKKIGELVLLRHLWTEGVREAAIEQADIEALARERYLADPPQRNEQVVVRQVLIRGESDDTDARERAEAIRNRVKNGESIEELARTFSTDSARFDGGLVKGSLDSFVPEFAAAVSKLSVRGELAPIVHTEYGFHVVQFEERVPAEAVPFAELADRLRSEVSDAVARRAVERESESFMREEIRFDEDLLARISGQSSPIE